MTTENEFKLIPNFGGKYSISKEGVVRSAHRNIILKQTISTAGYCAVKLLIPYDKETGKKQYKTQYVHRLVAEAFIPNLENKPQVNHIDGCKTNNSTLNLEWCTAQENTEHAFRTGLATKKVATNSDIQKTDIITRLLDSSLNWYDAVLEMGIHRSNAKKSILKTATELNCLNKVVSIIETHQKERAKEASKEAAIKNSKPVEVSNTLTNELTTYPSATLAAKAIKTTAGNVINSCLCGHSVKEHYKCVYI